MSDDGMTRGTQAMDVIDKEVESPREKGGASSLDKNEEMSFPQPEESSVNNSDQSEEKRNVQEESKSDLDLSPESLKMKKQSPLRFNSKADNIPLNPEVKEQQQLITTSQPRTDLETALYSEIQRKDLQIDRLTGEILKLKQFISKRKQVYKRKRKDEGAPTRALSAYNIFVQDRFSRLAKENEEALKSADSDVKLIRVPPARLVASTGNEWKELCPEEKGRYEERAKTDRKRYDDQMAKYQPPDKQSNRKRNKTGYNMFFSFHVNHLKKSDDGVPSERGSVARLVGNAWKELSSEEKLHFEREADKQNGMNSDGEEGTMIQDEVKRGSVKYNPNPPVMAMDPNAHRQMMPPQMGHGPLVHQPPHHDPRLPYPPPHGPHGPYQPYPPPPPGYYEYPPPPYGHAPHPPQQGTGQRGDSQDRPGQHQAQSPHPGYPGPPHHHPYHPPPHYPPHMEQR